MRWCRDSVCYGIARRIWLAFELSNCVVHAWNICDSCMRSVNMLCSKLLPTAKQILCILHRSDKVRCFDFHERLHTKYAIQALRVCGEIGGRRSRESQSAFRYANYTHIDDHQRKSNRTPMNMCFLFVLCKPWMCERWSNVLLYYWWCSWQLICARASNNRNHRGNGFV